MAQTIMVEKIQAEWSTGLFNCCEDMSSCCYGFWCCPCLACSTTEKFGECMCLPLLDIISPAITVAFGIPMCAPPAGLSLRVAIRHKYGIKGSLCQDIATSCFCDWCSWCQMARELKSRMSSPAVISMQPVVSMQPTPTVTTHVNLINQQTFGTPVSGYGPPQPSGPEYGYQPPTGPTIASVPGYGPPPNVGFSPQSTGPMIIHKN